MEDQDNAIDQNDRGGEVYSFVAGLSRMTIARRSDGDSFWRQYSNICIEVLWKFL